MDPKKKKKKTNTKQNKIKKKKKLSTLVELSKLRWYLKVRS